MQQAALSPALRGAVKRLLPPHLLEWLRSALYSAPSINQGTLEALLSHRQSLDPVTGRVVLVCGSLQPGGAERQVVNTLGGLAAHPLESVTLLCDYLEPGSSEQYDFYLQAARETGATVRQIKVAWPAEASLPPGMSEFANKMDPGLFADIAHLYREFRNLRPEVVHGWLDWSNVRAGLAAALAGVPRIVLSGRNLSPRHFALFRGYFLPAYRVLAASECVVLLNNSRAGAEDYAAWLGVPTGRITVLRNGVQFAETMRPRTEDVAALRRELNIPANAPIVGGMFRFNAEKRPFLWLEAASRVARAMPEAHFVLFGNGRLRAKMQRMAKSLGIAARLRMPGVFAPSLLGLSLFDLLLLTSSGEGTPNVLLEAQWLGVPIVTTDAGGAKEAIDPGVTGLVAGEDKATIANTVVEALEDKVFRDRARSAGPRFVAERYGMERMIRETLAAYGYPARDRANAAGARETLS